MEQYIPKSALVAEIERIKKEYYYDIHDEYDGFVRNALDKVLSFIDTLEVKEVDLEKEVEDWVKTGPHTSYPWCTIPDAIRITAEHFFELGLRVNNPITAADMGMAEEIIINLKRVEQDYHIDLTREMEWLRNKVRKGE